MIDYWIIALISTAYLTMLGFEYYHTGVLPVHLYNSLETQGFLPLGDQNRHVVDAFLLKKFKREFEPESAALISAQKFKYRRLLRGLLTKQFAFGNVIACNWRIKGLRLTYEILFKENQGSFGIRHTKEKVKELPHLRPNIELSSETYTIFTTPGVDPTPMLRSISVFLSEYRGSRISIDCNNDWLTLMGHVGKNLKDYVTIHDFFRRLDA